MPLPYYARLNRRDQAIYRRSVALALPPVLRADALRAAVEALRPALETGRSRALRRPSQALMDALCQAFEITEVRVRICERRPTEDDAELHGLYEREEGHPSVITAWMRTGARGRVVKFRTFLRTLLHEFVHHLDYEYFELADSFHTEGFFARESALMRSLCPPSEASDARPPAAQQLSLF